LHRAAFGWSRTEEVVKEEEEVPRLELPEEKYPEREPLDNLDVDWDAILRALEYLGEVPGGLRLSSAGEPILGFQY